MRPTKKSALATILLLSTITACDVGDSEPEESELHAASLGVDSSYFLWGMYTGDWIPEKQFSLADTEASLGKQVTLVGLADWWYDGFSWGDFNHRARAWANAQHAAGKMPVFMWQPYNPMRSDKTIVGGGDADSMTHRRAYSLKRIIAGDHDDYIRLWAQQIRDWKKPIYMRIMHELNVPRVIDSKNPGYFTTWDASLVVDGVRWNAPGDAINAWRHIVDIFREKGADNAQWIWSVLSAPSTDVGGGNPLRLRDIYPGDEYVDWIGVECYAFKTGAWEWCSREGHKDILSPVMREVELISKTKPVMLAEVGIADRPGKSSAEWIYHAFHPSSPSFVGKRFPRLKAMMYWNDTRYGLELQRDPAPLGAFADAIKQPAYAANHAPEVLLSSDAALYELVRVAYRSTLGREPDPEGAAYWATQLTSRDLPSLERAMQRFKDTPEGIDYHQKTSSQRLVTDWYNVFLGRAPDAGGLAHWSSVVDGDQHTAALRGFLYSEEFATRYRSVLY